jgi:acyl-CoA thioester hydrolase
VTHETTVRVRYGEVDRMGVVYHANYLAYFEQGRTELLRSLGRSYRDFEDAGLLLVVVDAGLEFRRPAGYDDLLRVRTRLAEARGARLRFEYEVERVADGVLCATGHTTLATTDARGRPIRPPDDLVALFRGASVGDGAESRPAGADGGKAAEAARVGGRSVS